MTRTIDPADLLDVAAVARLLGLSRSRVMQLDHVLHPFVMPFGNRGRVRRLYDRGLIERTMVARARHAARVATADCDLREAIDHRNGEGES